jgi:hypothetical protein
MLSVPHARAIPGQPYWLPIPSDCARCEHPATPMQRCSCAIQQVVPGTCSGTRLCGRIRARTRSLFLSATRRARRLPLVMFDQLAQCVSVVTACQSALVTRFGGSGRHSFRWVVKSVPFCKDERALFTPHMFQGKNKAHDELMRGELFSRRGHHYKGLLTCSVDLSRCRL